MGLLMSLVMIDIPVFLIKESLKKANPMLNFKNNEMITFD